MRVVQDHSGHAAIEIDPDARLLLRLGDENSLVLQEHPETWFEIIDGQGRVEYTYDRFWRTLTLASGEPYPAHEAIRKMMRGSICEPTLYGPGVLEAVMDCLPHGEYALFTAEHGFLGRYCCPEDAQMIAHCHQARRASVAVFSNLEEFLRLPADQRTRVALAVGATVPKKFNAKNSKEIYEMTSKAQRKKTKAAAKAGGNPATAKFKPGMARPDGPLAKAREIFAKLGKDATSADIFAATEKAGINKGTASVQLGKWRKENGIVAVRGPKKAAEKKPVKANSEPKTDKPAAKKKAAPAPNPVPKSAPARKSKKKNSKMENGSTSPTGQSETPSTDGTAGEPGESSDPSVNESAQP